MIIVLRQGCDERKVANLVNWLESLDVQVNRVEGKEQMILALRGKTDHVDEELVSGLDIVQSVKHISEPYKRANRNCHPDDTSFRCGDVQIGGGTFQFIAGPCSVESVDQITSVARAVKAAGAGILRGGAFKPRTSPYDFQGMRGKGIELLLEAKRETGLPIITEIMDASHLPVFDEVDIIQVGARNMQNFELLKELGKLRKPIFLKRGLANTLKELLMSAEYIMSNGNEQVILCERGIRTFETATRNTLDISAVPMLKRMTHLPVFVDPSHASGIARLVPSMAMAAAAAGADGLMIEVHNDPAHALCDGKQSLTPEVFAKTVRAVRAVLDAVKSNPVEM